MDATTAAATPALRSSLLQEIQGREARLENQTRELEAKINSLQLNNNAIRRRVDLLKVERRELQARVDSLAYEECGLHEKKASLQRSLGLLEAKLSELEAIRPRRLFFKFAKGVVIGALGAVLVLKL